MKDILSSEDNKITIGQSVRKHQEDILIMHSGWNKFYPHLGVGVINYFDDDEDSNNLIRNIGIEFEKDGMEVNDIVIKTVARLFYQKKHK